MITSPIIFSLVFFATFGIYWFSGSYIFFRNKKSMQNRVFLILCLSLCIWSFAFSIANSAPDYGTALFWRRVAALGWGSMYSFLLHFILILTEKRRLLKIRWIYILLYLPAIITVFVFSFYSELAVGMYNLTNTSFGWSNVSTNGFWDLYFNIYYISFTITSIGLIFHWRMTATLENKKMARLLMISILITLIVGSITDILINSYQLFAYPQVAPVIILIPITTILYCIRHYSLMTPDILTKATEEGKILNETVRKKIYKYLSLIYIFGSFMNFEIRYFIFKDQLEKELFFNLVCIIIGLSIFFIQNFKIKEDHQDLILVLILGASTPYIISRFVENASITIWAIPFIIVIISVLFNKQRLIILLSAFVMATQIWVLIKMPTATVQVSVIDHIVRIGIFCIFIWLAFFINRVYINRLKENEDHIRIQKMISLISADYVNVNDANLDEKINKMLQYCGEYFNVSRAYLILFSKDQKVMTCTHEWCNEGIVPIIDTFGEKPTDSIHWWMDQMRNNGFGYISDVSMLPYEAGIEKEALQKLQIKSLISAPLIKQEHLLGFLGFGTSENAKNWQDEHCELLKVIANILSDAFIKTSAEKEIRYMAFYDVLTGLPNRKLLNKLLIKEIDLSKRTEKFFGVVLIDLDSFKSVNDTMGHDGGDELIKEVACRLNELVRKHDTVSRFGGDEFIIVLTNIAQTEDITQIANKIIKSFEQPFLIKGQEFFITASAGIAVFPLDGEEAEVLIKNADMSMYASKAQGKNRYTICSSNMKNEVQEKMRLTNSLYRAQERNELVLYYQPQVCVATKKIIGLEALIRWIHPDKVMILPGTFIPLAEQTGLINPIGEWVLKTACCQSMEWQKLGIPPIRMAINLSVEQFRKSSLVDTVRKVLSETGLSSEYLELEITESIAINKLDNIVSVLNKLKELGVTIAIDDFGTEYSSLNRLKLLPIDRIKMDMQFVQGISENNKDESITKIIIQLARSLNLKVIAEGVETLQQMDFLTDQECDEVQGFYYYKPMTAEEIKAILINPNNQKR